MTKKPTTPALLDTLGLLAAYVRSALPDTKAEAAKLAKAPRAVLAELADWAADLGSAVDDAIATVEEAATADAEDREGCHASAQEDVETLLITLERIGLKAPEDDFKSTAAI